MPQSSRGLDNELKISNSVKSLVLRTKGTIQRVKEAVHKVELSVSSYDTAWVAMVPSPSHTEVPCFPECIDWIMDHQHPDGSWGLGYRDPFLIKDALSSTLACVLALKRWNVGEEQIRNGLQFITTNFVSSMDVQLHSPIGFDIIFPGMIENAMDMGLGLQVGETEIRTMLAKRDLELKRWSAKNSEGRKVYLAYVAEGLSQLQDWQEVMKYQRQNGSLFNSPSTTAAALRHLSNDKAFNYLRSIFEKLGNSVPTVYPRDLHTQLFMVDNLEDLGIGEYFSQEIKSILDKVHRCWVQNDEEITSDVATCAMAFRLLRLNGYNVSSGGLARFAEAEHFNNSMQGHLKDINAVLQLYKASQVKILANEQVLEKLNSWSRRFLEEELSKNATHGYEYVYKEVEYALKFPPYANLERLEHKRNIEQYNVGNIQMLKTAYTYSNISGKDLQGLALEVFNTSQSIYRNELEYLESWVKENRLDQLSFARQKQTYCYLSAAATLFSPTISDARICWAKNGVLTTVVDDFFDLGGSREEHLNLIALVEKWDVNENDFCSEQVKIVFSALHSTISELGYKASILQNRSVTEHIIEVWLDLIRAMMKEADWLRNKTVPSMDEYMDNGYTSFALGPIIKPALYFVGPELSEHAVRDPEYHSLYKLVSTCGRLLNDMQGFEREGKEGKLNSLSLHIHHSAGSVSEEEVKAKFRNIIDSGRTELLRLVVASEGSVVPRACKDLFWKMSRILHLFYMRTDGFTSPSEMVGAVNAVIKEPLKVPKLCSEDA